MNKDHTNGIARRMREVMLRWEKAAIGLSGDDDGTEEYKSRLELHESLIKYMGKQYLMIIAMVIMECSPRAIFAEIHSMRVSGLDAPEFKGLQHTARRWYLYQVRWAHVIVESELDVCSTRYGFPWVARETLQEELCTVRCADTAQA